MLVSIRAISPDPLFASLSKRAMMLGGAATAAPLSLDHIGLFWYARVLQQIHSSEELGKLTFIQAVLVGLVILAQIIYILETHKGRAAPSGITWLIWTFVNAVMSWLLIKQGSYSNAAVIGAYSFGAFLSFAVAVGKGGFGLSFYQKLCLALSLLALYQSFGAGKELAISMNVLAHFIGTIPLIVLVWGRGSQEPMIAWWLWWVAGLGNLAIAIHDHNLLIAPIYYPVHNTLLLALLLWKQPKGSPSG